MFDVCGEVDFDTIDAPTPYRQGDMPADELPDFNGLLPGAGKRGPQSWREHKLAKMALADGLQSIGKKSRADAIRKCCCTFRRLRFERGDIVKCDSECRDLVCPSGMMARGRRHYRRVAGAFDRYLGKVPGMQGLFVTLTMRNCASHELPTAIGRLIAACSRLVSSAAFKRAVRGWMRSIELTRNAQTGEWHAHVHFVWLVERAAYFRASSKIFITLEKLRALWGRCLRADYVPVVDIRELRGVQSPLSNEGRESLREVIKYQLKPNSLVEVIDGKPQLVGATAWELYDPGDSGGPRLMQYVPLRAVCDALKNRRLVATSQNLTVDDDADFDDEPDDAMAREREALGRFLCVEVFTWRRRGGDADYFLINVEFDEPQTGLGGRPLRP
jgi:plasmid rolling circle replication initiator protein Rep